MERSSFFNAILNQDGVPDRAYLAENYARYFASFIGNGVFPNPSTNLQILANGTDMNISLQSGKAWINGYFYENTDILTLPISAADGVLNRIDRIVLRLDFLNREIKCYVKKGTFASTPGAQVLQRDADMYEIGIADIAVNKGAIKITQANITDLRQNSSHCGIVHGTVEQLDITTLFNQYSEALALKEQGFEAEFTKWFDSIKGQLSGDVAGNLQNQINQTNAHLGEKVNISDTSPITTTGTASAYAITVTNPNLSEYTIVPHVNNVANVTISINGGIGINLKDRQGNNVSDDLLKINIPTKIVRVGNSFFIASGGTSDDDISIKIIKRIPNSPQIDNLIYDKVTDTIVCYNSAFLYKIDCKTGATLLTLAIDSIYNVLRFDEYNRTINYGGGYIIDYDTFKSVIGKRNLGLRDTDSSNRECTVIDYTTGILYSYDSGFNKIVISAINIDKTIIYSRDLTSILGNDKSPYSIAVSKDYIFVYARNTQSIIRLLKTDGSIHGYMQTPFTSTSKIFIRSSPKNNFLYIWTNTGENMRCWNGTQFIVVPSSGKGFTVSGDGVLLTADMFAINDSTLTLVTWDETITICKPIPTPIVNRINVALDYFISINNDTFYTFIQANNTKSMIRVKTKLLK